MSVRLTNVDEEPRMIETTIDPQEPADPGGSTGLDVSVDRILDDPHGIPA